MAASRKKRRPEQHEQRAADEGNVEPEHAKNRDQGDFGEPDEEERSRFAQDELDRPDGAHHDLLECADLPFSNHREGREADDLDQGERTDHARDEEPAVLESCVEPRSLLEHHGAAGGSRRSPCRPYSGSLFELELRDDQRDVSQCNERRVRIGSIDRYLQGRRAAVVEVLRETCVDHDGDGGPAGVEIPSDLTLASPPHQRCRSGRLPRNAIEGCGSPGCDRGRAPPWPHD